MAFSLVMTITASVERDLLKLSQKERVENPLLRSY
jgi:hypothetical protein